MHNFQTWHPLVFFGRFVCCWSPHYSPILNWDVISRTESIAHTNSLLRSNLHKRFMDGMKYTVNLRSLLHGKQRWNPRLPPVLHPMETSMAYTSSQSYIQRQHMYKASISIPIVFHCPHFNWSAFRQSRTCVWLFSRGTRVSGLIRVIQVSVQIIAS